MTIREVKYQDHDPDKPSYYLEIWNYQTPDDKKFAEMRMYGSKRPGPSQTFRGDTFKELDTFAQLFAGKATGQFTRVQVVNPDASGGYIVTHEIDYWRDPKQPGKLFTTNYEIGYETLKSLSNRNSGAIDKAIGAMR